MSSLRAGMSAEGDHIEREKGAKSELVKETPMDERLQKQLAFALEIDKEKNIFRQTHLSGHGRNENDA